MAGADNKWVPEADFRQTVRPSKLKTDLAARLNRIEGQVRGIKNMIDHEAYCDDILNQIAAANSALEAVGRQVLKNHIRHCVVDKIKNGDAEIVDELIVTIGKMN